MIPQRFQLFWPNGFRKKINFLKILYSFFFYVKIQSPPLLWPHPCQLDFNKLSTWKCSHKDFSFPGQIVFEKNIFKRFISISMLKFTPHTLHHDSPTLPLRITIIIWTNLQIYSMWGCFHKIFSISGLIVFEKMFKDFNFYI